MAQIISSIDKQTGKRVKIGEVSGDTAVERRQSIADEFGTTFAKAGKITGEQLANKVAPDFYSLSPISSDSLSPTPDFKLPSTTPSTAALSNFDAFTTSQAETSKDQFVKQQEARVKAAEKARTSSLQDYASAILEPGQIATTAEQYAQEGGVNEIQKELDTINNQILSEDRAYENEIRDIKDSGGSSFGQNVAFTSAQDKHLRRKADLSVIQQGVQGRYDSAKAVADRYVSAYIETQTARQNYFKTIYEDNKELFNKEESRAFEIKLADRDREIEKEAKELQDISDLSLNAMENGAPISVVQAMRSAKTLGDAMTAGGRYVNLLDRQLKQQQLSTARTNQLLALANAGDKTSIDKLGFDPRDTPVEVDPTTRRQQTDKIESTDRLIGLASQYKTLLDKYGYTNEVFGNTQILGQINSLRAQMTAAYKSAETLGTLDRGVLDLMDQLLGTKPTSSIFGLGEEGNIFANLTGRRSEKISSAMDTFIQEAQKSKIQAQLRLGIDPLQDTLLDDEDNAEIDSFLNAATFNAANYY